MTPSHDQGFHLAQLGRHSFSDRLPPQREPSSPRLRAHVREAEECERLGPAEAPSPAVLDSEPPKLDQARLLGVELQAEPGETLHQVRVEPLGVSTMLKADNEVVGKPHDDHVTVSLPPSPLPGPKIEDMVEVEVREQGGNRRPLRGSLLAGRPLAVLDNSRVQPFLDEPQDPLVRDAMLDEPPHPSVVDGVVEPTDVSIEYPVRLRYVHPSRWSRPVGAAVDPTVQILEVGLQVLPVGTPRHAVYPRSGPWVQRPIGCPQTIQRDVVKQRREPRFPVLLCNSVHTSQRTGRVNIIIIITALSPRRVVLVRVPLGQPPFLHQLRRRLPGLVRQLRRYYAAVRLPTVVHLGLAALAFPERPVSPSQPDGQPRDLPVLALWRLNACTGSLTARGPLTARDNAASDVAFRPLGRRRHPEQMISRLNDPAYVSLCQRFACVLTGADA